MRCEGCGRDNPHDARFCAGCGRALSVCPSCSAPVPRLADYCSQCGAKVKHHDTRSEPSPRSYTPQHLVDKILGARSSIEGERKQVTVLFADIEGSMSIAQQLDPEEWHSVMDRFFSIMCSGVHKYEGTVNQFTGDGVMALFGAPLAHEDHAQRACYAALHLIDGVTDYAGEVRRQHGLNFAVRLGLHSGEVVIGTVGDDLRLDYTAIGHTTGLAARMQELATADHAFMTVSTAELVSGLFDVRDLGLHDVKGVDDHVRVFELEGIGRLRTRLEVARTRGFSRFIGRADEITVLESALTASEEDNGRVVGVVGEPGLGKSRLCHEFLVHCRELGLDVSQGSAVAHGKSIPFLPFLNLLRDRFGITDQDSPQLARERIAGRLLLTDQTFESELPLLFDFLGIPDPKRPPDLLSADARERAFFSAVHRILMPPPEGPPSIILLEDLHWMDESSGSLLQRLVESCARRAVVILLNFRPEYHAGWMSMPHYQQLPLSPLGRAATDDLIRDLLGTHPSLNELVDLVRSRTGGNPFFVEEAVRSVAEQGLIEGSRGSYVLQGELSEIRIPPTVQTVLAARIDRLPKSQKALLQTASVIGKEFTEPVLRRVYSGGSGEISSMLDSLVTGGFFYQESLYPELEFSFKHPLTQEVAYGSQLSGRRAEVHAAVARVIEEIYVDRLDEQASLIARHHEKGGQLDEAVQWYTRAAAWAKENNVAGSMPYWRKIREVASLLPETDETRAMRVEACAEILNTGRRIGIDEDEVLEVFEEGRQLAESGNDLPSLALLTSAMGAVRGNAGHVQEWLRRAEEAVLIADKVGDDSLRIGVRVAHAYAHWAAGQPRAGLASAELTLKLIEQEETLALGNSFLGHITPHLALIHWFRGVMLGFVGQPKDAHASFEKAMEATYSEQDLELLSIRLAGEVIFCCRFERDPERALSYGRRGCEAASKIDVVSSSLRTAHSSRGLGVAYLLDGQWEAAEESLSRALDITQSLQSYLFAEADMVAELAESYLGRGDTDRALSLAEEAIDIARRHETPLGECQALLTFARASRTLSRDEKTRDALTSAQEIVERTGALAYQPLIDEEWGHLRAGLRAPAAF